jgi:predicted acetyltransferase
VAAGRGTVARTEERADLALDANDLAAMYLGGFSATALAGAGRVAELQAGSLATADRFFMTPTKPWCPQEF